MYPVLQKPSSAVFQVPIALLYYGSRFVQDILRSFPYSERHDGRKNCRKAARKDRTRNGWEFGNRIATAKQFIGEGAFVYITGRRQTELDRAVTTLGIQAKSVRAGASKLEDLDALYAQIQQEKGRLDVLFVNAGGGSFAPHGQITEEQFDEVLRRM
jgi:hypothetical protein